MHKAIPCGIPALKAVALESIIFPGGRNLDDTIVEFEGLSGLPLCAGVIDGTFMKIKSQKVGVTASGVAKII